MNAPAPEQPELPSSLPPARDEAGAIAGLAMLRAAVQREDLQQ